MAVRLLVIRNQERRSLRRQRVFRDRTNILDVLDDRDLISRYRLDRTTILELTGTLTPLLERATLRNKSLTPLQQILCALRFYSKGGFLSEVSDVHGISRATASRVITSVTEGICHVFSNKITFSLDAETLRQTKLDFFKVHGMPNVVGLLDGTLIPIIRPSEDEQVFVCRKQYHALNVQGICDANMKFTNVVAKWPGSTHDSFIWNNCALYNNFRNSQFDGWLLGDSGYPLQPWLMTPFLRPSSIGEEKYNKCHKKTRFLIERAFGVLKSRFRCLHKTTGCLLSKPSKCTKIVVACFVLHNICIEKAIPNFEAELIEETIDDNNQNPEQHNDGIAVRATLVRQRFSQN